MARDRSINMAPERYQDMTGIPHEAIADILRATHSAYVAAVKAPGGQARGDTYGDIKSSASCLFVAEHIKDYLNNSGKGYEASAFSILFPESEIDEGGITHIINGLTIPKYSDELIIADGTWQQFLPYRRNQQRLKSLVTRNRYPEVLIGTSSEIASVALGFGFRENQSQAWSYSPELYS